LQQRFFRPTRTEAAATIAIESTWTVPEMGIYRTHDLIHKGLYHYIGNLTFRLNESNCQIRLMTAGAASGAMGDG